MDTYIESRTSGNQLELDTRRRVKGLMNNFRYDNNNNTDGANCSNKNSGSRDINTREFCLSSDKEYLFNSSDKSLGRENLNQQLNAIKKRVMGKTIESNQNQLASDRNESKGEDYFDSRLEHVDYSHHGSNSGHTSHVGGRSTNDSKEHYRNFKLFPIGEDEPNNTNGNGKLKDANQNVCDLSKDAMYSTGGESDWRSNGSSSKDGKLRLKNKQNILNRDNLGSNFQHRDHIKNIEFTKKNINYAMNYIKDNDRRNYLLSNTVKKYNNSNIYSESNPKKKRTLNETNPNYEYALETNNNNDTLGISGISVCSGGINSPLNRNKAKKSTHPKKKKSQENFSIMSISTYNKSKSPQVDRVQDAYKESSPGNVIYNVKSDKPSSFKAKPTTKSPINNDSIGKKFADYNFKQKTGQNSFFMNSTFLRNKESQDFDKSNHSNLKGGKLTESRGKISSKEAQKIVDKAKGFFRCSNGNTPKNEDQHNMPNSNNNNDKNKSINANGSYIVKGQTHSGRNNFFTNFSNMSSLNNSGSISNCQSISLNKTQANNNNNNSIHNFRIKKI